MIKGSKKIINKEILLKATEQASSIKEIMAIIGTKIPTLKASFLYHNLPYPCFRKRNKVNDDFFDTPNEKSLYWAGFLAADGCLRKDQKRIKLELSTQDRSHIEKFKNDIKSEATIYDIARPASKLLKKNKYVKDKYFSSYIEIGSSKIFDDLGKYGVIPQKTYICTMPEWLINNENVRHFIRGFIDGDGSFSFNTKKKISIKLDLGGAGPIVKQIYEILKKECNTKYGNYKIKNNNHYFYFNSVF